MASRNAALPLLCFAVLALAACGEQRPPGLSIRSTLRPLSGACPESNVGTGELAAEVASLRVEITGPGIEEPVVAEGDASGLTVEDVPTGAGRRVSVFGIDQGGNPTWRGVREGVTVSANTDTAVEVLLTRIADLTCARTTMTERRAFHTATVLNDGRVLLVGGALSEGDASSTCGAGCTELGAAGTAEVYDPTTGELRPAGTLEVPRMLHQATLLPDGRVAISGGTSAALVVPPSAANPFPIKPRTTVVSLIEVWAPDGNDFDVGAAIDDPNGPRMFHAAALTGDGNLLLTGGIPSSAAVNDLGNALKDTTLCDGESLACVAGPPMSSRRAGHVAVSIGGDVLVWGGSVDTAGGGFKPEMLRNGSTTFAYLDAQGFSSNRYNLFFAAWTRYSDVRVLGAGGLLRDEGDATFSLSTISVGGAERGAVFVFDGAVGGDGALSAGPYDGGVLVPLALRVPTFFGAAAPLHDDRAVIAGGFSDLELRPSDAIDLYGETPEFAVKALSVSGQPRTLRENRGGLTATSTGDGAVLLAGGLSADGAGVRTPRLTAEVFSDPVDPGDEP